MASTARRKALPGAKTLAAAIEASAAALSPDSSRPGSNDLLSALETRLLGAARSYADTDARLKDDGSPDADRTCATAWQKCETIVEEIAGQHARDLSGLQVKARAVAWTASNTRDDLLKGIANDLLAMDSGAASKAPEAKAHSRLDLEDALMDASLFGRLAYHALCHLGFEKLDPPKLHREDSELVYWSMSQLLTMVDDAKAAFYEARARKRGST